MKAKHQPKVTVVGERPEMRFRQQFSLRGQQLWTEQAGRGALPEATPGKAFTPLGWALTTASSSQRGETNPDLQTHHHPRDRAGSIHWAGPPDKGFNRIKNKMHVKTVPIFEGS